MLPWPLVACLFPLAHGMVIVVAPVDRSGDVVASVQRSSLAEDIGEAVAKLAPLCHAVVVGACFGLCLLAVTFFTCGLPKKAPQHPSVKDGCSDSFLIFMGLIYTFTFFTTDQYTPSLPQMGYDLMGPQELMSATIQMNFVVKALAGIVAAVLSDRIGRRPVVMACLTLLSAASFCCASADHIEWFVAGRLLQGFGEAVEPVVMAMARDYFPAPNHRFTIIALLQMMSTVGTLVAPVFGGYTAQLFSWRFSFLFLSLFWALMAVYGGLKGVESCPDGGAQSWTSWRRVIDPHLMILLLTETCNMGAYITFVTNVSFVVEDTYGKSSMLCSAIMLLYCLQNAVGFFIMNRLPLGGVLSKAQISVSLYALTGLVVCLLGAFCYEHLWAYCVGAFLVATPSIGMMVSVNVLYMETLQDCAGFAASLEIVAKSVPSALYSVWSTASLIQSGAKGVMQFQGASALASGLVFWCYALAPPAWTLEEAPVEDGNDVKVDFNEDQDIDLKLKASSLVNSSPS